MFYKKRKKKKEKEFIVKDTLSFFESSNYKDTKKMRSVVKNDRN